MEKRNFYRLNYPPSARPALLIGGKSYELLNISEKGLKYAHPGSDLPAAGSPLTGTIVFADKEKLEVEGSVLRSIGTEIVVTLDPGIPFARIIAEQRRFLKTPPDL
jgi:hypothetical protein